MKSAAFLLACGVLYWAMFVAHPVLVEPSSTNKAIALFLFLIALLAD